MQERILATSLVWVLLAHAAGAQSLETIPDGSRVKLAGPTIGRIVGTVRGTSDDGLRLEVSGRDPITMVPWSAVSVARLSVERRSKTLVGALVGLALGTAVAGYLACCGDYGDLAPGFVFGVGVVVFGLPGAGVGALVGSQVKTDVWRDLPLTTRPAAALEWRLGPRASIRLAGGPSAPRDAAQPAGLRMSASVTVDLGGR